MKETWRRSKESSVELEAGGGKKLKDTKEGQRTALLDQCQPESVVVKKEYTKVLDDSKVNPTHLYTGSISNFSLPLCSSATCYTYQVSSIYIC